MSTKHQKLVKRPPHQPRDSGYHSGNNPVHIPGYYAVGHDSPITLHKPTRGPEPWYRVIGRFLRKPFRNIFHPKLPPANATSVTAIYNQQVTYSNTGLAQVNIHDVLGIARATTALCALALAHLAFLDRQSPAVRYLILAWEVGIITICVYNMGRMIAIVEVVLWLANDSIRGIAGIGGAVWRGLLYAVT